MCILRRLQMCSEIEHQAEAANCSCYKWRPIKSTKCQKSECPEMIAIINYFVYYLSAEMKAGVDERTGEEKQERNFFVEAQDFSEVRRIRTHSLLRENEKDSLLTAPSQLKIFQFLAKIAKAGGIYQETMVAAIIFTRRLIERTNWSIRTTNWRPLVITALRAAQKVEGKLRLTGAKLQAAYSLFQKSEYGVMDVTFLTLIDFRVFVSLKEYTETLEGIMAYARQYRARTSCLSL